MSQTSVLLIDAVIDPIERPVMIATAAQLRDSLSAAGEGQWQVQIRLRPPPLAIEPEHPPMAIIASLLPEVACLDEPISLTETRWRKQLAALNGDLRSSTFLCTIFRVVGGGRRAAPGNAAPKIVERIRRLNLLAADLSHDFGVGVIDIDRIFAHLGARHVQSDFRLRGAIAEEVAAYAIVSTLLAVGFGDVAPPEILARATRCQGPLWEVGTLVQRRLAERERQGVS
jgi:hypothetical protein